MNYTSWLFAACCLVSTIVVGQTTEQTDTIQARSELQQVVVSGSKFKERNSKIAVTIKTISQADLQRINISNMGNVLESSGLAFVQRSQQGGGSPVIRGFEASRVLLMVDGVRMNNAIYRSGHLQNIITVDPNILQNVEVLYGPSSTLYGSDALGGVVNIFTRNPKLVMQGEHAKFAGNGHVRYSSAIDEKMVHANLNYGSEKWGSLTSITYSNFGDVRVGKNANTDYPDFGLQPFYVRRVNNRDSVFNNPNPYKLKPTGYTQWDVMQKLLWKPTLNSSHLLNVQVSHSSDIPRFDRLTEVANNQPRYAEWYYGPQKRYLTSYRFEHKNLPGFFDELQAVASYQLVEESRYDRRLQQVIRNERTEKINVAGLTIDARKRMTQHEFVVGIDLQGNSLKSVAQGYNVNNATTSKITTRYPDGKNKMYNAAIFGQHIFKITDRLTLNDGLRLNFVNLESQFADTTIFHFPYKTAKQQQTALSGNAGLVYAANDKFKIATVFSTGFRSPNFDDLTKIFDSRVGVLVVPNPGLKPEYTYNAEVNLTKYFTVGGDPFGASLGGSAFYTWFKNAIVVDRFTFNSQDSVLFNGVQSAVFASQNKASAYLWGYNVSGSFKFNRNLQLTGTGTYTYGRYRNNDTEIPLDHIPPVFGKVALRYTCDNSNVELYGLFNGWKHLEDYSPSGEDNQQYATPEGMPSWYTLNARFNLQLGNSAIAQFGIENILDQRYRTFASGFSAPGRNLVFSLRTTF